MIMQEKIKVVKKQIPNSSNSFLFRKSYTHSKIPTDYPQNPWGFITVPIPIPYPYPWESPWESPYPRQPYHTDTNICIPHSSTHHVLHAVLHNAHQLSDRRPQTVPEVMRHRWCRTHATRIKLEEKSGACYSAAYTSQTRDQKRFTISEVAKRLIGIS